MEKRQTLRKAYAAVSALDSGNVWHEFLQKTVEKHVMVFPPSNAPASQSR